MARQDCRPGFISNLKRGCGESCRAANVRKRGNTEQIRRQIAVIEYERWQGQGSNLQLALSNGVKFSAVGRYQDSEW